MRTANPANVRKDFESALSSIESVVQDLHSVKLEVITQRLAAEHSLLAAAVLWEGFLNDLIVAYINSDGSAFRARLVGLCNTTTEDPMAKRALPLMKLTLDRHLSVAQIESLIDPKEYNLVFKSPADLKAFAGRCLVSAAASHFTSLTKQQSATIQAWGGLRNFLAHRSKAAADSMQDLLIATDLPARFSRSSNDIHDVGKFLLASPNKQPTSRLSHYLSEMKALAAVLCP